MLVEHVDQLRDLGSIVWLYPVLDDDVAHYKHNKIIAIVLVDPKAKRVYTLPMGHPDSTICFANLNFLKDKRVYAYDRPALIYNGLDQTYFVDARLAYYLTMNELPEVEENPAVQRYRHIYPNTTKINRIVSLLKHDEIGYELYKAYGMVEDPGCEWFYNRVVIPVIHRIESSGLYVDPEQKHEKITPVDGYAYTQYNLYTTTGRPSNAFGGFNYAAMPKDSTIRKYFVSRFGLAGKLVEIDFNAYHPRLIASLTGYYFGNEDVYAHLAKHYYDVTRPTKEQIKQAKEETFRQIYGGIRSKYARVPFFERVQNLKDDLWDQARRDGVIFSPISQRPLSIDWYDSPDPNLLFNYLIQLHETENNMLMLDGITQALEELDTKAVLYTYDSVLFDVSLKELDKLMDILRSNIDTEQFPIKLSWGDNYGSLERLEIPFD